MTEHQISKSKLKQQYRFFWTKKWRYEYTPEKWLRLISSTDNRAIARLAQELVEGALQKMILEKKFTVEEGVNFINMLKSPDKENTYIVICAMAVKHPKKFKKVEHEQEIIQTA